MYIHTVIIQSASIIKVGVAYVHLGIEIHMRWLGL